jgi:hypothetical protein
MSFRKGRLLLIAAYQAARIVARPGARAGLRPAHSAHTRTAEQIEIFPGNFRRAVWIRLNLSLVIQGGIS